MKDFSIVFGIEADKRSDTASVLLKEGRKVKPHKQIIQKQNFVFYCTFFSPPCFVNGVFIMHKHIYTYKQRL